MYKGTQKPKTAKIYLFFLLLLLFCKTTNSAFIQESNLEHHNLEIKLSDLQPRIKLLANHRKQPDLKSLSFILDTGSNISLIRKIFSCPKVTGKQNPFD
ncbi:MAG: hypothetical protein IPO06_16690 [Leptospiraceae bacterium]|nr:hypothetical protein [Leptospiraceae bacterium]